MARLPRSLTVRENYSVHKMWQGHNKEYNLGKFSEKLKYLELLNEDFESERYKERTGNKLHAICIMGNHTHEVSKITSQKDYSSHMRRHHARYGAFFNKKHKRKGKVALDRAKTCLIAEEDYEIRAVLYAHSNPLRANIVRDAKDYSFSTHKLYAFGKREAWMRHITLPEWYMKLAKTMKERQRKYRKLYAWYLKTYKEEQNGNDNRLGSMPMATAANTSFTHRPFYGPLSWVQKRQEEVKAWRLFQLKTQALSPP